MNKMIYVLPILWFCLGGGPSASVLEDRSEETGSMKEARYWHTATLLNDGRVLVAGGATAQKKRVIRDSCELFDPKTGTWSDAKSLPQRGGRIFHTATLLQDGRVLIVGGTMGFIHDNGERSDSFIYDPEKNDWSPGASMSTKRSHHTATLLKDGRVLIAGGASGTKRPISSCEIYDPKANKWTNAPDLKHSRYWHQAILLSNGNVLVLGGLKNVIDNARIGIDSCEVYDPSANAWKSTEDMKEARGWTNVAMLSDGKVLVAGGFSGGGPTTQAGKNFRVSEVYDPEKGTWTLGAKLGTSNFGRFDSAMTVLSDGSLLITGGVSAPDAKHIAECERYAGGEWKSSAPLKHARVSHTATLLADGCVLIAGGTYRCAVCRHPAVETCEIITVDGATGKIESK